MADIKGSIAHFWEMLKGAGKKFGAENASLSAAGISFYAFLSLLPLLLLAVAILGYVMSSEQALNTVAGYFSRFMPADTGVTGILRSVVNSRGVLTIIGILGVLWSGSSYFVTLQIALNDMWEVGEKPGFVKSRIRAILMVIGFGILLLLTIGSSTAISYLSRLGFAGTAVSVILSIVAFFVGLVFAVAMFALVYKYDNNANPSWRSVLIGAVFAGVVWVIAKELYRVYVTYAGAASKTYGSLGGIVLLILWIYYSSMILLFGAELGYVYEHGAREEPEEKERM